MHYTLMERLIFMFWGRWPQRVVDRRLEKIANDRAEVARIFGIDPR